MSDYQVGQRVYYLYDTGAFGVQPSPCTVTRVNRVTYTVETYYGTTARVRKDDVVGLWQEDEETTP